MCKSSENDEVVSEGVRRGGAGKGPPGLEEGKDRRSSSHPRGDEDDGGQGLGLLREERTALLVQIAHLNFTEPQGVPSTLSDPLKLCSFGRMLLTVLSALTERDPVKWERNETKAEHIPLLLVMVECQNKVVICSKTPINETHQQQDTMTLNSEKREYLLGLGGGVSLFTVQYSFGSSSEAKL